MKKFFLLLVAALPMVFTSCGDDNDDDVIPTINLNFEEVTMDYEGKFKDLKCLDAQGKELKNVTWTIEDEFVATVDSKTGELTAKYVGETKVKAIYENASKTAKVIVKATNNDFNIPILDWKSSMKQIQDAMSAGMWMTTVELQKDVCTDDYLSYQTINTIFPIYGYTFADNQLVSSNLTAPEDADNNFQLTRFLGQRYKMYPKDNGKEGVIYMCNALDVDKATLLVEYATETIMGSEFPYVIWVPAVGTKTRSTGVFQESDFEAARELVRAQIKAAKGIK